MTETTKRKREQGPPSITVTFKHEDIALIIDALLQAEMTLPLLDWRYRSMDPIQSLRAHQLELAERLEDMLAAAKSCQDQRPLSV